MSHKTSVRVWEHSQTQRAARCLMLALADFANDDGICWPGTAVLAKKINESADYTDTIIKKCIAMGELAKHAGQGRGHTSRFAILCGLAPDAQNKLKGVLQKGYPSTPIEKRGTPKGVLIAEKRGTFSGEKHHTNGASEPSKTPISENEILHDPIHDGDGDGARALESYLSSLPMFPKTIAQILALHLDPQTVIAACDMLLSAGWGIGAIADHIRKYPPVKGQTYERPDQRPAGTGRGSAANGAERLPGTSNRTARPRGSHNPTGGAELRDPGWMDREIAAAEARARSEL